MRAGGKTKADVFFAWGNVLLRTENYKRLAKRHTFRIKYVFVTGLCLSLAFYAYRYRFAFSAIDWRITVSIGV